MRGLGGAAPEHSAGEVVPVTVLQIVTQLGRTCLVCVHTWPELYQHLRVLASSTRRVINNQ